MRIAIPLIFDVFSDGNYPVTPPGNTGEFDENHEILKDPRIHSGTSRRIRDHS